MTRPAPRLLVPAVLLLSACATPAYVGGAMKMQAFDASKAERETPAGFQFSAEEIHRRYGSECRDTYYCNVYTDEQNYYLVPDSGIVLCFSGRKHCATVVVDGRTGEVVRRGR